MISHLQKAKPVLGAGEPAPISGALRDEYNSTRNENSTALLCHAPFKSMRLSLSGNVLACCYNRQHILGSYPGGDLHDIWFGDKANELREQIKNDSLVLGCGDCERNISTKNFQNVGAKMYDYLPNSDSNYPVMLDFELSNICNLECVMCNGEYSSSIRKNREKQPAYPLFYDEGFVTQLEEFIPHLEEARFVGGEPFLNEINYLIWEKMIELNPKAKISVLTNATILNKRVKSLLNQGNFHVSVSIDSLQKANYEKIRLNANFEQVMQNVDYLYDYSVENERWFNFNMCPMRQNWKEIPEFFRFCNEKNIGLFLHTVKFPLNCSLWNLSSKELSNVLSFLERFNFKSTTGIQKDNIKRYNGLITQVKNWIREAPTREMKQRHSIDAMNREESHELFLKSLNAHMDKNGMLSEENKREKMKKYRTILEKVEEQIADKDLMKTSLANMGILSPDIIMAEMEISTPDRLVERFKMAAQPQLNYM